MLILHSRSARLRKMAYISLLAVTAVWGIAGPVIKLTLNYIPPFTFLFYRFLIVCTILLPFTILETARNKVDKRDIPNIIILGLLGQTSISIIFLGLRFTTALDAALIATISPILVIAAGHYFYNEKVNKSAEIGVLIATIGTLTVVVEPAISNYKTITETGLRIFGNILILIFQLFWPFYIVFAKRMLGQTSKNVSKMFKAFHLRPLHKNYPPMLLTTLTFYVGLATIIPLAALEALGVFGTFPQLAYMFNATSILGLFYMALLSSIIGYGIYLWALQYVGAREGGIFGYINPIFTIPAAYILLGEVPTKIVLLGALVIFAGVAIAEKYKS